MAVALPCALNEGFGYFYTKDLLLMFRAVEHDWEIIFLKNL